MTHIIVVLEEIHDRFLKEDKYLKDELSIIEVTR